MHLSPRVRRSVVATATLVVLAAGAAMSPSNAAPASLSVTSVNNRQVVNGEIVKAINSDELKIKGVADAPRFFADAGDSLYVKEGDAAPVRGTAALGTGPYTYAWSFGGSASRFAAPTKAVTSFSTTGLASGPAVLTLTVTDDTGAKATDTVTLFVHVPTETTLLDESVDADPVVLDDGGPDGTGWRFPFGVPTGTTALDLTLDWGLTNDLVAFQLRAYDLFVDDPSGAADGNTDGAQFGKPERIHLSDPAVGDWAAIVKGSVNGPDTFNVTAVASVTQPDPTQLLTSGGPYRFVTGAPQVLTATVAGGTAPIVTEWDLNFDGLYDVTGSTVTTNFGLGNHFVAVKTTDAAGYEKREIVPVLITEPGTAISATPFVVVAVSDTGINPYHEDFGAARYPDSRVLDATANFTKHPSTYLDGYPANTPALPVTLGKDFAPGKLYPAEDAGLFTRAALPLNTLFWIPGTKIIGAIDASDVAPVNGNADATPLLDDDGHGTASASVAVGNLYGYCTSCLLAFGEGFAATEKFYTYPWVDLASNSFGSLANVGFAGLFAPDFPKENAERGQIALYAAGNGNENAFVTPEQTYTSENLGPDWIVRVGAVDRSSRQPFTGTGKPVDVSSFGLGENPAAVPNARTGTTDHSGTSAATPYTTGVMGSVLTQVRSSLGDGDVGTKNAAGEFGVIAKGTPVASSPYLADGKLTRAELTDVIFKTAQHEEGSATVQFPPTIPSNEFQYLAEGYGIVEPASGLRALDVLFGRAPLPVRAAEDEFFAADSFLRDQLWGTWNGGGTNSSTASSSSSASPVVNPFAGVTKASVANFDAAFRLLSDRTGPFSAPVISTATNPGPGAPGSPTVAITDPSGDVAVNADASPVLDLAGTVAFPSGDRPTESVRYYPRRKGVCATTVRSLTRVDGPDDVCVFIGQVAPAVLNATEAFPLAADEPAVVLDPSKPVTGTIYVQGQFTESPVHQIRVDLLEGTTVLGGQTVSGSVLGGAQGSPFPYSFPLPASVAGKSISGLTLRLRHVVSTGLTDFELDTPASFIDLPIAQAAGMAPDRRVEVSVDGGAPRLAVLDAGSTSWTSSVDVTALSSGSHTVSVKAIADGLSSPVASFVAFVSRGALRTAIEVQLVANGATPDPSGWTAASALSADRRTWRATLPVATLADGGYTLVSRMVFDGSTLADGAPVRLRLS